jgi:regulatory subunit for Cdc7p protein kinase
MGMKIWAAEKLQRVLASILDDGSGAQHTRATTRVHEDLSRALRNDKISAASERDQPSQPRELNIFKGPYIYVHDMDERYRPTMVREYKPAARKGDGEWPQFRSAGIGKCPFIEDASMRREMEQDRVRKAAQQRAVAVKDQMQPPRRTSPRKALREVANPAPAPATINPAQLHKRNDSNLSFPPMPSQLGADVLRAPGSLLSMPREPAASGIQRSNMTSAIQSNMISSTAATGAKATTSKEVNELKRKVLERSNAGSLSHGSIPSSHRMTDLAGALNARAPAPSRVAKSKAQEKLGGIQEEDGDECAPPKPKAKKRSTQRDPKPGYCENCRDKYEDFEEVSLPRRVKKIQLT